MVLVGKSSTTSSITWTPLATSPSAPSTHVVCKIYQNQWQAVTTCLIFNRMYASLPCYRRDQQLRPSHHWDEHERKDDNTSLKVLPDTSWRHVTMEQNVYVFYVCCCKEELNRNIWDSLRPSPTLCLTSATLASEHSCQMLYPTTCTCKTDAS